MHNILNNVVEATADMKSSNRGHMQNSSLQTKCPKNLLKIKCRCTKGSLGSKSEMLHIDCSGLNLTKVPHGIPNNLIKGSWGQF